MKSQIGLQQQRAEEEERSISMNIKREGLRYQRYRDEHRRRERKSDWMVEILMMDEMGWSRMVRVSHQREAQKKKGTSLIGLWRIFTISPFPLTTNERSITTSLDHNEVCGDTHMLVII